MINSCSRLLIKKIAGISDTYDSGKKIKPDKATLTEKGDYDAKAHNEKLKNFELNVNIWLRVAFAIGAFFLVTFWLFIIAYIILCSGCGRLIFFNDSSSIEMILSGIFTISVPTLSKSFTIDSSVLIALISGSTINVIGLLTIVMLYLFPSRKSITKL